MNSIVQYRSRTRPTAWWLALAMLFATELSMAQTIPLHLGTTTPIKDEYGANLMGTMLTDPSLCDRVEVLWATNGIFPPDIDGNPDPRNAPVIGGVTTMGSLTDPGWTNPGLFAASIASPRPTPGAKLFVRVFNAPTREAASFYGDSAVFTVDSEYSYVYDITISSMNPLDASDNDSDGLNNSWEKSLGADPSNRDTDGDYMIDGDEFRAGTDMLDEDSVFVTVQINPDANGNAVISWDSVAGKRYQVECMDNPMGDPVCYTNVSDVITATSDATETIVTNGLMSGMGKYRVRLVEP